MPWRNGSVRWLLASVPKEGRLLPPWSPALVATGHRKSEYLSGKSKVGETKNIQWRCAVSSSREMLTLFIICLCQENIWDIWFALTADNSFSRKLSQGICYKKCTVRVGLFWGFLNGWLGPDLVTYIYCHVFLHMQWNARHDHRIFIGRDLWKYLVQFPSQSRASFRIIVACSDPCFSHCKHFC